MTGVDLEWTGERLVSSVNNVIMIEHLHRYAITFELIRGKKVLDIACGEGYGSALMSDYASGVTGVDIDSKTVLHASRKYKKTNLNFLTGSTDSIPIPDNSVDVVVSFETIEHHDHHDQMMSEIKRVLKPGGFTLISSPEKSLTPTDIEFQNHFHVKELTIEEFGDLASKYFKSFSFLKQSMMFSSVITSNESSGQLIEYSGDYRKINSSHGISTYKYNILMASDSLLPSVHPSLFRADQQLEQIYKQKEEVYNSKTYKVGNLIVSPGRTIYRIFKRIFS